VAHIAQVGRKSPRVRLGIAALYVILILGAITTLYPFLLMISVATKSQTDFNDFTPKALIPRYWYDENLLFAKYAEDKYANNLDEINAAYNTDFAKPIDVLPPTAISESPEAIAAWRSFKKTLPDSYFKVGFGEHDNAPSLLLLRFRDRLRQDFGDDIGRLNVAWTEENVSFDGVTPPFERTALREWAPDLTNPKIQYWYKFRQSLPENYLIPVRLDPVYQTFLRQDRYEDKIENLNVAWGTSYKTWQEIPLPPTTPDATEKGGIARRADWEKFIRTKFPLRMLQVDAAALPSWRQFLTARNRANATEAQLPTEIPLSGQPRTDWMEFIASAAPLTALRANSTENLWRDANTGKSQPQSFRSVPPIAFDDHAYVKEHAGNLRMEFATRNFKSVTGFILLHGKAVWNTLLFCLLAILGALIVNPMCAYALSRYNLPYGYHALVFILATMAFPAEVVLIPNFLLLKELNLLNTFAALILPSLASGFSIFLLKGFFDSLPRELYEAATMDGASELMMFGRITVPLSLPIFSVIALNAFTAAYGAFLFAMVVCQNPNMWTLMVWLYDLQDKAPQYVIMAALTLAALPTLLVFLVAQKVILRGIILPSFK
jgi:multiple sugar transport system permease protein